MGHDKVECWLNRFEVMKFNSRKILAGLVLGLLAVFLFLRLTKPSLPIDENVNDSASKIESAEASPKSSRINPLADEMQAMHREIEAHRLAREAKEARENWIANFPFKPTYHPTLVHDPARYDSNNPATFSGDPEMEMAVKRHGYMFGFFNHTNRFSAEFEQIYHLLGEIDRQDNPEVMGQVFWHVQEYHRAMKLGDEFGLESLYSRKRYRPYDPERDPPERDIMIHGVEEMMPVDGKTTWVGRANSFSNAIVGLLVEPEYWPDRELLDANVARAMRDRLLAEVPESITDLPHFTNPGSEDFGCFGYHHSAMTRLKAGDPLLTPFPHHAQNP